MLWFALSLLAAFGQALNGTLKKKTLRHSGINAVLGFVSYSVAAVVLFVLWGIVKDFTIPVITQAFVLASLTTISLNVVAVWAFYKALDPTDFSRLMPFMAINTLFMVPIEYVLQGQLPNMYQVAGMIVVIIGAIHFAEYKGLNRRPSPATWYFLITLICYSVTSPSMDVMRTESQDPFFSATVMHIGMAIGFIPLMLWKKELSVFRQIDSQRSALTLMCLTGLVIALLENGPVFIALGSALTSEVFAIKRTMPIFALLLGRLFFGEQITRRQWQATGMMVIGSVCVVWFK